MKKLISVLAISGGFTFAQIAPAFANPTSLKIENGATVQQASPNLVELEGRSLTDAEAAKVEGEWVWVAAKAVWGAGTSVAFQYAQCQARGQSCSGQDYAWAAGTGAVGAFIPVPAAAKGVRRARQPHKK